MNVSRETSLSGDFPIKKDLHIHYKTFLSSASTELGIVLTDEQLHKFILYLEELKAWSKRIGLTSLTSDHDIIIKHFVDSLSSLKLIPSSSSLVDLGSGAGFPGIPLKIAQPSMEITLIDSSLKKIHFQKHIIRRLSLTGIKSFHHRAENGPIKELGINRGDIVISRAFSKSVRTITLGFPFLKKEGRLILMLGKNSFLKEIKNISISLGMEIDEIISFQLPFLGHKRHLISFVLKKSFH